jgi:hypothetical protein
VGEGEEGLVEVEFIVEIAYFLDWIMYVSSFRQFIKIEVMMFHSKTAPPPWKLTNVKRNVTIGTLDGPILLTNWPIFFFAAELNKTNSLTCLTK